MTQPITQKLDNTLVQNTTDLKGNQVVNARDLHAALEVKTKFADWIKRTIEDYDYIEDQDYCTILKKEKRHII